MPNLTKLLVATLAGMVLLPAAGRAGSERLFSLDDVLKLEGVSSVAFDPAGEKAVLQKLPPYQEIGTYANYQYIHSHMTKLMVRFIGGDRRVRPLFPQEDGVGYFLSFGEGRGFSPDGNRLIVYRWYKDDIDVGVFDFSRNKVTWLALNPAVDPIIGTRPIWLSNSEFLISTLPEKNGYSRITRHFLMSRILNAGWNDAVAGNRPTAKVHVSKPPEAGGNLERAADFRDGTLVRVNARTGSVETVAKGVYSSMQRSPDGRYVAAMRHGGILQRIRDYPITAYDLSKYRLQPVVFDTKALTRPQVVCTDCDAYMTRADWSPDSKRVVFFLRHVEEYWNKGRLAVYRPSGKQLTYLDHTGLDLAPHASNGRLAAPDRPAWTGEHLAVFASPVKGRAGAAQKRRERVAFHISDESPHGEPLELGRADWYLLDPDGRHENLTSDFDAVSHEVYGETADAFVIHADGALWQVDTDKSKTNLTADFSEAVSVYEHKLWQDDYSIAHSLTEEVALTSKAGDKAALYTFNLATGAAEEVHDDFETIGALKGFSLSGRVAVVGAFDGYTEEISLVDLQTNEYETLFELNRHLHDVSPMRQETITYTFEVDGQTSELKSCVTLPPDWTPGKTYPTIVEDYPLVRGDCPKFTSIGSVSGNFAPLISKGYVHLNVGHDPALLSSPVSPDPLENLAAMTLAAVDAAVAEGYVDPERMGLYGLSAGGIGSLRIITETNAFKAVVSKVGMANFASTYAGWSMISAVTGRATKAGTTAHFETAASNSTVFMAGATPWNDPDAYVEASPFFSADKITTPLMLIHSELDQAGTDSYRQMFEAMNRLRKEAVYIEYRGEGHSLASPANIRHQFNAMAAWFNEHLGGTATE